MRLAKLQELQWHVASRWCFKLFPVWIQRLKATTPWPWTTRSSHEISQWHWALDLRPGLQFENVCADGQKHGMNMYLHGMCIYTNAYLCEMSDDVREAVPQRQVMTLLSEGSSCFATDWLPILSDWGVRTSTFCIWSKDPHIIHTRILHSEPTWTFNPWTVCALQEPLKTWQNGGCRSPLVASPKMQKMEASPFFDVFCVNGLLLNTTKFGNEMLVSGSKIPTCEEVMA